MLTVLAALCAAMVVPVVARDGPSRDPDDLQRWTAGLSSLVLPIGGIGMVVALPLGFLTAVRSGVSDRLR
jgi:hypothetical protein